ncbi:MAG TPA: hypothetical protein VFR70_08050, partial [Flavobacterium sp.]|nr:hypothetical protein [Flavobacterium sp.]
GNSGGAQNYANLQSPNFSVDGGAKYLLRFKGKSTNHHMVSVQNAMAAEPWSNIAPGINVLLDQSVRDYFYLFTPTQNQNPARINLTQNVPATAYLDDFSLFKYTSIVFEDAKQRSPLFINPTAAAVTVNLLGSYRDLQNNIVSGTMVLPPWSSKILVRTETAANTIWNGTSWSNGVPTVALDAIIAGDYNTQANGTFTAKTLSLNSGVLTVSSGTTLTVENAIANNAGADNFIVQSGGSLIQTGIASNTGPITVQRASAPIVRLDHTLWSSPVSGQNLFSFSPNTLPNRFYTYATSTNTYVNTGLTSSTAFMPGKGYAVRAPNNFPASPAAPWTGTFKGIPNNGSFSFALSVAFEGYNLIGNPYPSAISAVSFVDDPVNASKIDGTLYFYAHSLAMNASGQFPAGTNYATWNKTGHTLATNSSVVPNGTIQTGQGFIVKAVQPGSVSFTNSMRSAGTGPFFRSANSEPEKHRLWLDLSNEDGSVFSQALVGYVSGATLGFDRGYDGLAFGNTGSFISTKIGGSDYAIQARPLPFDASDVVPLSFRAVQAGSYSITLSGMDGVFSGSQDVFLKDNASGILHNLKSGAYAFSSAEGTFDGRFQVVYQNALGTPESVLSPGSIAAFSKAGVLHVESKNMEINSIKAYDVQGRLVYSKSGINAGSIVLEGLQAQNQLLLLQIASSGGAAAIKVIF